MANPRRNADAARLHARRLPAAGKLARVGRRDRSFPPRMGSRHCSELVVTRVEQRWYGCESLGERKGMVYLRPRTPAIRKATTAVIDGAVKLPTRSDIKPAKAGPVIWPRPNAPVIQASARRGSPVTRVRARTRPSAVNPMKVPPTRMADRNTPILA